MKNTHARTTEGAEVHGGKGVVSMAVARQAHSWPRRGQAKCGQSGDWRSQERGPTPGNVDAASCRVLVGSGARRKRLEASSALDATMKGLMP